MHDDIMLTTEHSASSYGQPIALFAGEPFGPGDLMCVDDEYLTGAQLIERWAARPERSDSERADAARFLHLT